MNTSEVIEDVSEILLRPDGPFVQEYRAFAYVHMRLMLTRSHLTDALKTVTHLTSEATRAKKFGDELHRLFKLLFNEGKNPNPGYIIQYYQKLERITTQQEIWSEVIQGLQKEIRPLEIKDKQAKRRYEREWTACTLKGVPKETLEDCCSQVDIGVIAEFIAQEQDRTQGPTLYYLGNDARNLRVHKPGMLVMHWNTGLVTNVTPAPETQVAC